MEWTNEAKCQILDFCRRAEEEQTETDPVFTTLFTKPNLVLSFFLDGSQSFGKASKSPPQGEYHLLLS